MVNMGGEADSSTAVESREGNIYCGNCQDFIYDPELEIRRLQKGRAYTDSSLNSRS
jgi:hypothetical protein